MRKPFLTVTAAALLLATAAFGGDPWKDKPWESWDQKDVQKVLNDSPWARQVDVGYEGGPSDQLTGIDSSMPAGGLSRTERRGGAQERPQQRGVFIARWYSARTIRQAEVRSAQLRNASSEEAAKLLAATPQGYQLMVIGTGMEAFGKAGEESLKQGSYLELKKSRQKIAPSRVLLVRPEGQRVMALVCEFPRKTAGGEVVIAPGETNVDFVTRTGELSLRFRFDIAKMTGKQGADL